MNKYKNTYHSTIKTRPVDVKSSISIDLGLETNKKDPKFKFGDHVRISKYKNIFGKGYVSNWTEEVFVTKKVKNTVPWAYVITDPNDEEIFVIFYDKEFRKTNQKGLRVEKIIKRKDDKLYVKWKDYKNSFNSWIDKKEIV